MQATEPQSCDKIVVPAAERVRRYLELCRDQAPRGSQFALGGAIPYVYGTAQAADLVSERALVGFVLRFANGEEDTGTREWFFETQRERLDRNARKEKSQVPLTPEAEASLAQLGVDLAPEKIEAARAKIRGVLESIRENRRQTVHHAARFLRDAWPLLQREPNPHLALCWVITSVDAFNTFVARLLLDDKRDLGCDLRRCRLETCGRFFFVEKSTTGLPRRLYCTEQHMNDYHKARSYGRVLKSRARRAKKARKSK